MSTVEESKVLEIVADVLEMDIDEVGLDAALLDDLGADSLDIVDVAFSLGKAFGIKMPTKTVLGIVAELAPDLPVLQNFRLTELGARMLQNGPNLYTAEVAKAGASAAEVLAATSVRNWYELCCFVASHPTKNGDLALSDFVTEFAADHLAETV